MSFFCRRVLGSLLLALTSSTWAACYTQQDGLDRSCARDASIDEECAKPQSPIPLYGFHEESCLIDAAHPVIPEIFNLRDGAAIPHKVYAKHSSTDIGRNIVHRYFQKVERPNISREAFLHPDYDYFRGAEVQLAFDDKYLPGILQKGFLNEFQIGHSNGTFNLKLRNRTENELIKLNLARFPMAGEKKPANRLRPKYAYLGFSIDHPGLSPSVGAAYGNVYAVMRPEAKARMTFTPADSLATGFEAFTTRYISTTTKLPRWGGYYEAQIWGDVTMDDVHYLLVNCYGAYGQVSAATLDLIAKMNPKLNVYACEPVMRNSSVAYYAPTQLLRGPGDPTVPLRKHIVFQSAKLEGTDISEQFKNPCGDSEPCHFSLTQALGLDTEGTKPRAHGHLELKWKCQSAGEPGSATQTLEMNVVAQDAWVEMHCRPKPEATWKFLPQIQIVEASFGGPYVALRCNGRQLCHYKVTSEILGGSSLSKARNLTIKWKCSSDPEAPILKLTQPISSINQAIDLYCSEADMRPSNASGAPLAAPTH